MILVKKFTLLLTFCFFIIAQALASSGKENNDNYSKVELEYQKGNYKTALELSDKYVKEVENLVGKNHFIYARLVFQNAKINEAMGDYASYRKHLVEAKKSIAASDKKDIKSHADAVLAGVDCYIEYGDYASAQELLANSKLINDKTKNAVEAAVTDKIMLKYAEILLLEGFTNKAFAIANASLEYRNKRDVKKDVVLNEKTGSNAKVSLTSAERLARKKDIAEAINLLIRIYIANGLYAQADSMVEETAEWIEAVVGKKDLLYVKNMMLDGQLLDIANETDLAAEMYDQAMNSYKKIKQLKSKLPSRMKLDLYERQIGATRFENDDRADNQRRKMYKEIADAYGEENSYMSRVKMSEAIEYFLEEKFTSADTMLRHFIANKKYFPVENLAKAKALDLLADVQIVLQKYKEAEQTLQHITTIKKKFYSPNSPVLQLNLLDLANFKVAYSNDFKSVDTVFAKGIKIIKSEVPASYPVYFEYHYKYAKYLYYADRLDNAENVLKDVCQKVQLQFGKKSQEYAQSLCQLSNAQTDNGNFAAAMINLNLAQEALNGSANISDADKVALIEQYIHYYTIIGDFEEVQQQAKKVKRIIKKEKKFNLEYAGAIEKNIELKINQGDYDDAEADAAQLLTSYTEALGKDNKRLTPALDLASRIAEIEGNYGQGEAFAQRSVDITKLIFGDSSLVHMQSLSNLQRIYVAINEYDLAEKLAEHIVAIYRKKLGNKHYLLAQSLNSLGQLKLLKNDFSANTATYFKEALSIIEATLGKEHPQYAEVLINFAQLKIDIRDFGTAEKYLTQAHKIYADKFGEENIHTINSYFMMGNLHVFRRSYESAKKEFAHARSITNKLFGKEHPMYVKALSKEVQMEYALGNYKQAAKDFDEVASIDLDFVKKYFEGLSEKEKNIHNARIKSNMEFFYNIVAKLGAEEPELVAKAYNYALASKAMLLSSSIKTRTHIHSSKDSVLIQKYQSWVLKKEILSSTLSMSILQKQKDSVNSETLQKEIHALEKDIKAKSQVFESQLANTEILNWQQIRDTLKPNEVAVEMLRCRYFTSRFADSIFYLSLLVTPHSKVAPELTVIANGSDMEKKYFSYYRNCIRYNIEDNYSRKIFWEPLKSKIGEGKKIYFSPDGVFNLVNLEGLSGSQTGRHVIDEEVIVLVSNTKDILHRTPASAPSNMGGKGKVELFGNPDYYALEKKFYDHIQPCGIAPTRVRGRGKRDRKYLCCQRHEARCLLAQRGIGRKNQKFARP